MPDVTSPAPRVNALQTIRSYVPSYCLPTAHRMQLELSSLGQNVQDTRHLALLVLYREGFCTLSRALHGSLALN